MTAQLRPLVERCEHLLVQYEHRISAVLQANIAVDSAVDILSKLESRGPGSISHDSFGTLTSHRHYGSSLDGDSDLESFVSALDVSIWFQLQ